MQSIFKLPAAIAIRGSGGANRHAGRLQRSIAVFIAGSKAPEQEREKVMSNIASRVVEAMQ